MTDIEIKHLNLIRTVAEEGSLTKASNKLYLTQSALSHQLRDLEERFKVSLFVRTGKKMHLTTAGSRLLESALTVRRELDRAYQDLSQIVNGESGVLRLSTECYTCYHWLPPVMIKYSKDYPNIDVRINLESTHRPLEALIDRRIEVALVSNLSTPPRNVVTTKLFSDQLVVIMGRNHPLSAKRFITAKDFESQTLLAYDVDDRDLWILQDVLFPAGVYPKSIMKVPLTEAIIQLVGAGVGLAVLSHWAAQPALKSKTIIARAITQKGLARDWSAAFLKEGLHIKFIQHFIDYLKSGTANLRISASGMKKIVSGSQ